MKKSFLGLGLVLVMTTVFIAGCGDASTSTDSNGDYSSYCTLGEYKGLKVDKPEKKATAVDVRELREEALSYYIEYKASDAPAANGDLADLEMTAKSGDEIIYDFTGEDSYEITIGDYEFGQEFDNSIIGKSAGDSFKLSITYGDSEEDVNLAGRTIDYDINVKSISNVIYPEVTDELVKEIDGSTSVAEWEAKLEAEAQANIDYENQEIFRSNLGEALVLVCTFTGYPDNLFNSLVADYEMEYEQYAEMFGTTVDDIYEMFGVSHSEIEESAKQACYQTMALSLVAEKEGLNLSDEETDAAIKAFMQEYEYDTEEDLFADYSRDELISRFVQEKTLDFLADKAIINVVAE